MSDPSLSHVKVAVDSRNLASTNTSVSVRLFLHPSDCEQRAGGRGALASRYPSRNEDILIRLKVRSLLPPTYFGEEGGGGGRQKGESGKRITAITEGSLV